jgi:hypothetical protein
MVRSLLDNVKILGRGGREGINTSVSLALPPLMRKVRLGPVYRVFEHENIEAAFLGRRGIRGFRIHAVKYREA